MREEGGGQELRARIGEAGSVVVAALLRLLMVTGAVLMGLRRFVIVSVGVILCHLMGEGVSSEGAESPQEQKRRRPQAADSHPLLFNRSEVRLQGPDSVEFDGKLMTILVIGLVAFAASGLTLFAGFGLGTLLMPAFALFFPVELAVGLTAVVHLANNVFKLALLGRRADRAVVVRFGLPALAASFAGAKLLILLSALRPLASYELGGRAFHVMPVNAVVAALLLVFVALELSPRFARIQVPPRWLPLGGLLSGFFGGLSGHQGALRSAFLVKTGLAKEAFVASGVAIACLIDAARLSVYAGHFSRAGLFQNAGLLGVACVSAFLGAYLGARLLEKVTMLAVQRAVAAGLVLIAAALGAGLI